MRVGCFSWGFADPVVAAPSSAVAVLQHANRGEGEGREGLVWLVQDVKFKSDFDLVRVGCFSQRGLDNKV